MIARGEVVAEDGRCLAPLPDFAWPDAARRTVRMGRELAAADFDIPAPAGANRVRARVIGVVENQAPTRALEADLAVDAGLVAMDPGADVCQIALVERHRGTGAVVNAFVSGFGYDVPCAVASTVAHDSHHMIVVGTSKADMALRGEPAGRGRRRGDGLARGARAGAGAPADRGPDVGRAGGGGGGGRRGRWSRRCRPAAAG